MKNKGITLISLVITIIVLLILAGITISLTIGENGIFNAAKSAGEETTKAQIKQEIEFAILEIQMEEVEKGNTVTLDRLAGTEQLLAKKLDKITAEVLDNTIVGEYKEYNYIITDQFEVIIDSKVTGMKVTYSLAPMGYTKDSIVITIEAEPQGGAQVSNITSNENLEVVEANKSFKITQNGTYKFTVTDSLGKTKTISIPIEKIDTTNPTVKIDIETTTLFMNGKAKAKIVCKDDQSGINNSKSKWVINKTSTEIGTTESVYTGGTLQENENTIESTNLTTAGTYYIHVLAVDNVGNMKEYISGPITVKEAYTISTPQDFQNIKNNLTAEYYVVNDIDMGEFSFSQIKGTFTGKLDGQGHTISNITINATNPETGIFLWIQDADFKNIVFKNLNISSTQSYTGGIAAQSKGTCNFEKVGIEGNISSGGWYVGSFVGHGFSGILNFKNCYAKTKLKTGTDFCDTAGFATIDGYGGTKANITNCYWSGTNNATMRVGSLVSIGQIGNNENQMVAYTTTKNSYYNKETFSLSIAPTISGTGLTTNTMRDIANDTNWDFVNDWYINEEGFPKLKF